MAHLALVTGAGRRLGRAIALRLGAEGCDVVVHYRSSQAAAEDTANEIVAKGSKAMSVCFDQTDPTSISDGLSAAHAFFGQSPDVLVNSASIFEWDDIENLTEANLLKHFQANLFGPVHLTQKIFEASTEQTRGLVLNMLDQKLFNPNPDHLSYTLSKYALQGFTELMSRRLAPRFRVNAIAPGYTLPDVGAEDDTHFKANRDNTPLERGPTEYDIADAAAYLLKAHATTGQTILVDGGSHTRPAARDFTANEK